MAAAGGGGNGTGNGAEGHHGRPPGPPRPVVTGRPGGGGGSPPPRLPQPTPEQTCLGCTIALAVVLVSVLFWAWFFWRQGQAEERTLREQQLQTPAGRQRARQQDRPGAR